MSAHRRSQRTIGLFTTLLLVIPLLAACGGGATGATASATGPNGLSMSVTEPTIGATVTVPFTIKVSSGVSLGVISTGMHHLHIWFDGDANKYEMVESDTGQAKSVPAGAHTMHVSLRNADHTAAGVDVEVPLTVSGPGSTDDAPAPGY
jgi:hypothetical protein